MLPNGSQIRQNHFLYYCFHVAFSGMENHVYCAALLGALSDYVCIRTLFAVFVDSDVTASGDMAATLSRAWYRGDRFAIGADEHVQPSPTALSFFGSFHATVERTS